MVCLGTPYHFKFFKGCLPSISLGSFLNTLNQMSVLHQSMYIFKAGLSRLIDGRAKYKEKVPDVSDSNQNLETKFNSKLRFTELKNLLIKRVQKN